MLEEQRQIPERLARASRDLDLEQVTALRRRLGELPAEIYAAQLLELGRASESLKTRAEAKRAEADALSPALAEAEERLREATEARNRVATEIQWCLNDAADADQTAVARERELENLIAEMFRREVPVARSLSHAG